MECLNAQELLDAYIDDALPLDVAERVRRHLATCPACAAELAEIRRIVRYLDDMPDISTPFHLARSTIRAFRERIDKPGLADWWRGLSFYMRGVACGIALAGLVFGIFLAGSLSVLPETTPHSYIATLYHTEELLP